LHNGVPTKNQEVYNENATPVRASRADGGCVVGERVRFRAHANAQTHFATSDDSANSGAPYGDADSTDAHTFTADAHTGATAGDDETTSERAPRS
jgi:hypothetical protein